MISTRPDTFAVVEPFRDAVVFRFSERISEQASGGTLEDAVVISPPTGEVEVEHSRDALEVSLVGGFEAGRVYRVTLRTVVRDMFGNTLQRPFELVFSTGPAFHPNAVAGLVEDRITGEAVSGARVNAMPLEPGPEGDTLTYTSVTDEEGIFTLRYLPAGEYALTAFEDRNRDRRPDPFETRGEDTVRLRGPSDTVLVTVPILAADTTPAGIAEAEVIDSASLRIATDDHLDPARSLDGVRVSVSRPDGEAPAVDSLLHAHEWTARRERLDSAAAARADTAPRDTAAAVPEERAAEAPDRPATPPGPPSPGPTGSRRQGPPRAEREIYAILADSLAFEVPYTVRVSGIVNIQGVEGGGGEATLTRERPPPADTVAPAGPSEPGDTAQAADTAGRRPLR